MLRNTSPLFVNFQENASEYLTPFVSEYLTPFLLNASEYLTPFNKNGKITLFGVNTVCVFKHNKKQSTKPQHNNFLEPIATKPS